MEKENSLKKIKNYIDSNLQENLDLDKLAKEAGYSKYHLERLFTKHYGCTVTKYIREERLKRAAIQLAFTNASILEIALGACYESQQAFTLAFKRLYQTAPGSYRNNIKEALSSVSYTMGLSKTYERRMAA